MNGLSTLELAVAKALAQQVSADGGLALIEQMKTARVIKRDFTGVGFFTEFEVDRSLARASVANSLGGWVRSSIGPENYPLEFMLYVRDGFAEMIEAYSFLDGYGDLDLLTASFTEPEAFEPDRAT